MSFKQALIDLTSSLGGLPDRRPAPAARLRLSRVTQTEVTSTLEQRRPTVVPPPVAAQPESTRVASLSDDVQAHYSEKLDTLAL